MILSVVIPLEKGIYYYYYFCTNLVLFQSHAGIKGNVTDSRSQNNGIADATISVGRVTNENKIQYRNHDVTTGL